jgi:hypothetical protein
MSIFYGAKVITTGLILSYDAANTKSYPGSGSTWYDLSGNGNHGTINSGELSNTWLQNAGNVSNFFSIDTPNSTSINSTFSVTVGGWTIEESVYTYSTTYPEADAGTVISNTAYGTGNTGIDWQHGIGVTQFTMGMSSNSASGYEDQPTISVPSPYNAFNVWRLRTMVWNRSANTFTFYINGNLIGSASTPNTAGTSVYDGGGCSWGTLYGWNFFGRRSTIRVYNFPFTQDNLTTNWNSWRGRYGL